MPNGLPYLLIKSDHRSDRDEARLWTPPRPVIIQLDRLTAQRTRLGKGIKILQTPLTDSEGFIDKADRKANQQACAASLKSLKADINSVDKLIVELAEQDPELKRLFERVTARRPGSVVGSSQTTAAEIIFTTASRPRNEFKAITDSNKFVCYAGVFPFEQSSGQRKGHPQVSHERIKKLNHYFIWPVPCYVGSSALCSIKSVL